MALSGPDNWGSFRRRRHKLLPFSLVNTGTGRNTIYSNSPDWLTNAADNYSNTSSSEPVLNWDLPPSENREWVDEPDLVPLPNPSNWPDPGLWAGDERVWRGITIPQTPRKIAEPTVSTSSLDPGLASGESGVAKPSKGGKWKKIIEQLGKMTGPEPDWSLSPQKMGVPSPWSPTNTPYAPTAGLMGFQKKKKGPY